MSKQKLKKIFKAHLPKILIYIIFLLFLLWGSQIVCVAILGENHSSTSGSTH